MTSLPATLMIAWLAGLLIGGTAIGQDCGTVPSQEVIEHTKSLVRSGQWDTARHYLDADRGMQEAWIAMTIHVVRYSGGSGGIPTSHIDFCVDKINEHMLGTGLRFLPEGDIIYIDDSGLADSTSGEFCDLMNTQAVPGTINIYFVPELDACGRASFPGSSCQGMVVANGCADPSSNDSTFSHEIGHYFHLYHTHQSSFGDECVDGSNCLSAGDLLCDTPADPNVSGLVNSATCEYEGTELDPCGSGQLYDPDTANLLCYGPKLCRDHFSPEQQGVMVWSAFNERPSHLRYTGACCVDGVCSFVTQAECADGDWYGVGTTCLPSSCASPPDGACCVGSVCTDELSEASCVDSGGEYLGAGTICVEGTCDDGDGVYEVPADFPTIQMAIDAAGNGDEIIVGPGVYRDLGDAVANLSGKSIWLHSSSGPEVTIIDGELQRPCLELLSEEDEESVVEGFTIIRGYAPAGGGIRVNGTAVIIDCIVRENVGQSFTGGMMSTSPFGPTLTNVDFCHNIVGTSICANTFGVWSDQDDSCTLNAWCSCPGDSNRDTYVTVDDLLAVIQKWGQPCLGCDEDLYLDGEINVEDLLMVLSWWNEDCPSFDCP